MERAIVIGGPDTEHKQAEAALRLANEQLHLLSRRLFQIHNAFFPCGPGPDAQEPRL